MKYYGKLDCEKWSKHRPEPKPEETKESTILKDLAIKTDGKNIDLLLWLRTIKEKHVL